MGRARECCKVALAVVGGLVAVLLAIPIAAATTVVLRPLMVILLGAGVLMALALLPFWIRTDRDGLALSGRPGRPHPGPGGRPRQLR